MDVWVFAAAAGAVNHVLKNLNRSGHSSSSKNLSIVKPDSPTGTEKGHQSLGQELLLQRKLALDDAYYTEVVSTSEIEGKDRVNMGDCGDRSMIFNEYLTQGDWENRGPFDTDRDSMPQSSSRDIAFTYAFRQWKSSRRSRGLTSKLIKPRTSLESCLMAQLYKEHGEHEECCYSIHPPEKPILMPFIVTDGSKVISGMPFSKHRGMVRNELWKDTHQRENESVVGIPRLPDVSPMKVERNDAAETGQEQDSTRSNNTKSVDQRPTNAQKGLADGKLLFFFGLTVGVLSSFMGNKQEIEKLEKSLAQTENLVQDLQEELEMKDALIVKELPGENHEVLSVQNDSRIDDAMQASSLEEKLDGFSNQEICGQSADAESFRKIEAELEAELDMLESNMNSSRLEGKLSNLAELDPTFSSIEGEFRDDIFSEKPGRCDDGTNSSTPPYARYPVSPRDLSIRLHQVIQSRLESRVLELEMALQQSEDKIKVLESDLMHPQQDFPSLSCHGSPIGKDGLQSADEPIVINLSGDALAAYNEAYEVFTKLSSESDEDQDLVQNESEDDEMEKLLIRQIVEKAKQGSPAVVRAQRAFLSIDNI